MLLAFGDTVSYKMGGWSGGHREVRPNALLHWTGMQWAKGQGHRYYDLEGINADIGEAILSGRNPADIYVSGVPLNGVTHFKLGLGGEVTRFPGCYDYSGQPLLRAAWPSVAPRLERADADCASPPRTPEGHVWNVERLIPSARKGRSCRIADFPGLARDRT